MELDFTFERQLDLTRKEEREIGREEGIKEGKTLSILSLMKDGTISSLIAAEKLGISEEEVLSLAENSE